MMARMSSKEMFICPKRKSKVLVVLFHRHVAAAIGALLVEEGSENLRAMASAMPATSQIGRSVHCGGRGLGGARNWHSDEDQQLREAVRELDQVGLPRS
ncbi:hypothetical protein ACLB2K_023020 [Fragaria x ananassa]